MENRNIAAIINMAVGVSSVRPFPALAWCPLDSATAALRWGMNTMSPSINALVAAMARYSPFSPSLPMTLA
ncbi:hypothetical protein D3C80_1488630 [compost metagenome]